MNYKKITKRDVLRVCGKSDSYYTAINLFLFNCVMKEIVGFNGLTNEEKKSLVRILEGDNKRWFYDPKMKKIIERKGGDKNYNSI